MNFAAYSHYFETILNTPTTEQAPPYDNEHYLEYTKLNWARMNRWLKTAHLNENLLAVIRAIDAEQHWIVITEPWCGDAAHIVPFIEMAARENSHIHIRYELRDSEPFLIEQYLTHGTKSIPKFIIRDAAGNDLGVWGPRPAGCQQVYDRLKAEQADFERIKTEIQLWYNTDKGVQIQEELTALLHHAVKK